MNILVKEEYKKIRKPRVGRYAGNGEVYHHILTAKTALKSAKHKVKTQNLWEEAGDSVRLRVEPDYTFYPEDLMGDAYNPEANPDINPTLLEKQKKEFIQRCEREGIYFLIGEYECPCCGEWTVADSVGGFVGDDWKGSRHDIDIMNTTVEAYRESKRRSR